MSETEETSDNNEKLGENEEEEIILHIGVEESHSRLKIKESERPVDNYYLLMDLMHQKDSINEIQRLGKLVEESEGDVNLAIKLGIARRKVFDTHRNYPVFVKEHFKDGIRGKDFFREARKIESTNIHVLYNIAKLFVNDRNEEKFRKYYNLMKEHHPESPWTCFVKGFYLVKMDRLSEGIEHLEKNFDKLSLLKSTKKYGLVNLKKSYLTLKNRTTHFEIINRINEAFVPTKDTHFGLKKLGWHYITKSKGETISPYKKEEFLQKAEESFVEALKIATTRVYHGLGIVYEHRKKYEVALKYHDLEIENDPFAMVCFKRKVFCYIKLKRWDEALESVERLEFIKPSLDNHLKIADIYNHHTEKYGEDESIKYLEEVLTKYEKPVETEGEVEDEEEIVEKMKEKEKERKYNLYRIYDMMSIIQYRNRHYERAIESVNKAVEVNPEGYNAYLSKGKCILFIHRFGRGEEDTIEAIECFDKVIELAKAHDSCKRILYDAYRMKGWIYEQVPCVVDCEKSLYYYKKSKYELKRLGGVSNQIKMFYVDERISSLYLHLEQFGKAYRRIKDKVLVGYEKYIKGSEKLENAYKFQASTARSRMERLEREQSVKVLLGGKGDGKSKKDFLERMIYFEEKGYEKVIVVEIFGKRSLFVYQFLIDMNILT